MSSHIYACGQPVSFTDRRVLAPGPTSEFVIVRLLPIGDEAPRYEVQGSHERFTRVAEEMNLQAEPTALDPMTRTLDMNTIIDIVRSITAALLGALGNTQATRPAPARVKLATRNGYGNNDDDRPRS